MFFHYFWNFLRPTSNNPTKKATKANPGGHNKDKQNKLLSSLSLNRAISNLRSNRTQATLIPRHNKKPQQLLLTLKHHLRQLLNLHKTIPQSIHHLDPLTSVLHTQALTHLLLTIRLKNTLSHLSKRIKQPLRSTSRTQRIAKILSLISQKLHLHNQTRLRARILTQTLKIKLLKHSRIISKSILSKKLNLTDQLPANRHHLQHIHRLVAQTRTLTLITTSLPRSNNQITQPALAHKRMLLQKTGIIHIKTLLDNICHLKQTIITTSVRS